MKPIKVICCECGKEVKQENSAKHSYNKKDDYCISCHMFWFN
jgi:hypothetical protein